MVSEDTLNKFPIKGKIVRDAVHGDIFIPEKFICIIDTPEFQRLRRIKQLSVADMVFPGANHTRFSHSIGTFYIMGQMIAHFRKLFEDLNINCEESIPEDDENVALLAALLHDIGHGPFSHTFEKVYRASQKDHEKWTQEIILNKEGVLYQEIVAQFGHQIPEKVASIIDKQRRIKRDGKVDTGSEKIDLFYILSSLVSSQIDADRMDYLIRDSFYAGVNFGKIDLNRLIASLQITVNNNNYVVYVPEKYIQDVESYLLARFYMQKTVYFHDFKIQMEEVIRQIIITAQQLYLHKNLTDCPNALATIFSGHDLLVNDYLELDDNVLFHCFDIWRRSEDETLAALCEAIINRKKAQKFDFPKEQNEIFTLFKKDIVKLFSIYGVRIDELKDQPFWFESTKSYLAYKPRKENIWIQSSNGLIKDISDVSQIITNKHDSLAVFESADIVAFINYNIINSMHIKNGEKLTKEIKELARQYNPRNSIEIEKKYHFSDEKIFVYVQEYFKGINKFRIIGEPEKQQTDVYYDTKEFALYKNNSTLRVRTIDDSNELTIKMPVPSKINSGQSERFEFQKKITSSAINNEKDFISEHLLFLHDVTQLEKSLEIINYRQPITLSCDNIKFEIALDKVTYLRNQKTASECQLEIELKSEYAHRVNLKMLTDELEKAIDGLIESNDSKYVRGLELTKIE